MEENCWSKHLYGKQHLRALEKAPYAKKQQGSESFCQTGPPFVPVISRNKEDRDADIYEMDRQESEEIWRSRSSSVTRNDEQECEGRERKKGIEKGARDMKPEDKADSSNSLVQGLTSKLTIEELRKALLAAEQEETRLAVKCIMPQESKKEETVYEQSKVCEIVKDVRKLEDTQKAEATSAKSKRKRDHASVEEEVVVVEPSKKKRKTDTDVELKGPTSLTELQPCGKVEDKEEMEWATEQLSSSSSENSSSGESDDNEVYDDTNYVKTTKEVNDGKHKIAEEPEKTKSESGMKKNEEKMEETEELHHGEIWVDSATEIEKLGESESKDVPKDLPFPVFPVDRNQVVPMIGKVVRECVTAVSSAINAKNHPAPVEAALSGVANQMEDTNMNLVKLTSCLKQLNLDKEDKQSRVFTNEVRTMARNIESIRTDFGYCCDKYVKAAQEIAVNVRENVTHNEGIKVALNSLTLQMKTRNELLARTLQAQTKEFRRLSSSIEGFQEALRQGGTTCNLVKQIIGIPTEKDQPKKDNVPPMEARKEYVPPSSQNQDRNQTESWREHRDTYHTSNRGKQSWGQNWNYHSHRS